MTHKEIAALLERLELHPSWRDSHGELNAAPNDAATALRQLMAENERLYALAKTNNELARHETAARKETQAKLASALGDQP